MYGLSISKSYSMYHRCNSEDSTSKYFSLMQIFSTSSLVFFVLIWVVWFHAGIFTLANFCCSKSPDSHDQFDQFATPPIYDE